MMTEENEKKKEYLSEYRGHIRRITRIEAELEEIRAMKLSPSMNNDGVPHGNGQSDLSEYASNLDELERNLMAERTHRVRSYENISKQIGRLKSENEKDVLFYHYIKGLSWWEIAEKMKYSERWIHKLHGQALAHLNLSKEFMEIQ